MTAHSDYYTKKLYNVEGPRK